MRAISDQLSERHPKKMPSTDGWLLHPKIRNFGLETPSEKNFLELTMINSQKKINSFKIMVQKKNLT
jgi:hypothetical protein